MASESVWLRNGAEIGHGQQLLKQFVTGMQQRFDTAESSVISLFGCGRRLVLEVGKRNAAAAIERPEGQKAGPRALLYTPSVPLVLQVINAFLVLCLTPVRKFGIC
jgi:hypothetical protein